jgi:sensor histidine kinase YesM
MIISATRLRLAALDLARSLLPTIVINLLCALAATYLMHIGLNFSENLIFAMCIGLTANLLINGTRLLLWGRGQPHKGGFLLTLVVLAPVSVMLGNLLATFFLRRPLSVLTLVQSTNIIAVIVLTLLASAGATLFFWNREKMAALQARNVVIEKQAVQAQLQMLQAQIEPHMLFNTLATLQTLISSEPLRAQQMLDQLIHYLRATLSTSREAQTTLGKEFELIQAYLGLMSLRMGMRLTYTLHLPDELRSLPIAPMLLQPLIENAIRHGLEPKIDGGDCTVRVTRHQELLIISVLDSGMGLRAQAAYNKPASSHLGLENIRARLDALYGPQAELTLTHNIPRGAMAQLSIPIQALTAPPASLPAQASP